MHKKNLWLALISTGLFLLAGGGDLAANPAIEWHNYQDGMARGKFEKKQIFLHFYADWCGYCKKMAQTTFKDPTVIEALNRDYIPIRVNTDLEPATAALYKVEPIPDTWFIFYNGEPNGNRRGYVSAEEMKVLLKLLKAQPAAGQ